MQYIKECVCVCVRVGESVTRMCVCVWEFGLSWKVPVIIHWFLSLSTHTRVCVHLIRRNFCTCNIWRQTKPHKVEQTLDFLQHNSFCCCRQQQIHLQGCLITDDCDCNAAGGIGGVVWPPTVAVAVAVAYAFAAPDIITSDFGFNILIHFLMWHCWKVVGKIWEVIVNNITQQISQALTGTQM